jgi:hypothetical protein
MDPNENLIRATIAAALIQGKVIDLDRDGGYSELKIKIDKVFNIVVGK